MDSKLVVRLDWRIICAVLLVIIVAMLAIWRPWQADAAAAQRKITIVGEATVKAEPDQYQFNPSYTTTNTADTTAKSQEITTKLKALGVADNEIKTNANNYSNGGPETLIYPKPNDNSTLSFTITLTKKDVAQKVQDYLLTTNPTGSVTPYPSFSTAKQKALKNQARDLAIADAKTKADHTAQGLNAKLGKVIEVKESQGQTIFPYALNSGAASTPASDTATKESLTLQPGQDELSYSIDVTFELK
jgi:uncharacterized protein YggE